MLLAPRRTLIELLPRRACCNRETYRCVRPTKKGPRGVTARPEGDFVRCCNNNVDAGTVIEFGRAVYCGSVKKLELNRHGRNASDPVGTMTVNGC